MFRILAAVMLFMLTLLMPILAFFTVPIFLLYIASAIIHRVEHANAYAHLRQVEAEVERRKILKALS